MAIAVGDAGVANTSTIAVAALDRGWTMYAHQPVRGIPLDQSAKATPVARVWESLRTLHDDQISHGDLRSHEITEVVGQTNVHRRHEPSITLLAIVAKGEASPSTLSAPAQIWSGGL